MQYEQGVMRCNAHHNPPPNSAGSSMQVGVDLVCKTSNQMHTGDPDKHPESPINTLKCKVDQRTSRERKHVRCHLACLLHEIKNADAIFAAGTIVSVSCGDPSETAAKKFTINPTCIGNRPAAITRSLSILRKKHNITPPPP